MFEYGYYYEYGTSSSLGIGLSVLKNYLKKYSKTIASSTPSENQPSVSYSYYTAYYSNTSGVGFQNIALLLKLYPKTYKTAVTAYTYYNYESSFGIGISLLNNF